MKEDSIKIIKKYHQAFRGRKWDKVELNGYGKFLYFCQVYS